MALFYFNDLYIFLQAHTMYQVGLMETDQHIQFFWNTLSGLSQEDLGKFIKFSCNQERIPQTCPCRDGSMDSMHVPPYPMKIAPPDGPGKYMYINHSILVKNVKILLKTFQKVHIFFRISLKTILQIGKENTVI